MKAPRARKATDLQGEVEADEVIKYLIMSMQEAANKDQGKCCAFA